MSAFTEPGIVFMTISREEAEDQLRAALLGSYLVRPSSRAGSFSLSYKNATDGRVGHLLLTRTPAGWTTEGVPNAFPTVRVLLRRLPYGLRVDDDQMYSASAHGAPASAPMPGYTSLEAAPPLAGYGKVPNVASVASDGYGRAPAPAGDYGSLNATASASEGYGRAPASAPGGYAMHNVVAGGFADYGRVPAAEGAGGGGGASAALVPGDSSYGRVPLAQTSPYARLNPTAGATVQQSPQLSQRTSANAIGVAGPGYGRVPVTGDSASTSTLPRRPSVPDHHHQQGAHLPHPAPPPHQAPPSFVAARRNLPVTGPGGGVGGGASSPSPSSPQPQMRAPRGTGPNYASVAVAQSGTVNAPHQFAMQALQLMQGNAVLAGHERFLRAQLGILAKAKEKAATSTPVYTALVALGQELSGYVTEMRQLVLLAGQAAADAMMRNAAFQQHYVSIQMQMRDLKSLLELGDGFQQAIQSELGHLFWSTKIGKNNSIGWGAFFQVLQAVLGMNLLKVESFVRFMFDCNKEGKITTQSFNMFIHWFDFEGMKEPTTVKEFLTMLIARAETVFFFEGFHGFCSREKAERILAGRPPKSYIIRLSDSSAGVFILSYIDSKLMTRHRLLNQVDKQGFMVEQQTYNTLPDLLAAHSAVLAQPVSNSTAFDTTTDAIYGGGDALYESLASAAVPVLKSGDLHYYTKLVINRHWMQVRLELRETELVIATNKSPLRRSIPLTEITECALCQSPPTPNLYLCFRVVANQQPYVFGCADPQDWVQQILATAAEQRRQAQASMSAVERSAEEKMAMSIVTRRADLQDTLGELLKSLFLFKRRAGEMSPFDLVFLRCLNTALAKVHAQNNKKKSAAPPPVLWFSKLELDMQMNGAKCEVEVPVRDTIVVRNDGGAPVEFRVDNLLNKDQQLTLKFVPNQITLAPGQSEELHVTLLMHQTATVRELVHVSVGPNRGHSSIFFALEISSKMMESLVFEQIDFGPRLGSGAFGQVFHGAYRGREVAIKAVGFEPDYDQELNILRELRVHPNIVEYIGCCFPAADHEILTSDGFLSLAQFEARVRRDRATGRVVDWRGLRVANYDPVRRAIVYDEPRAIVDKMADDFVEFESVDGSCSVRMTANHDAYVRFRNSASNNSSSSSSSNGSSNCCGGNKFGKRRAADVAAVCEANDGGGALSTGLQLLSADADGAAIDVARVRRRRRQQRQERVWCFTMPDAGFVVVRRRGSAATIQGNCKRIPFQGFIVLEFMSLGSLDKYIHDPSFQLTLQLCMRVAYDVANGLAHLHRSKIMHLDMKPANVLVSSLSLNSDACVKLADFGLSQSRDSAASFRGEFVEGTLLYMAPEMLREKLFSQKGDCFSFGMTLWEMLKREQPYSGEKHRKLKKPEFEEVRERGELPGELSEIDPIEVRELLSKMLSFDHEARPTAEECSRMIQAIRVKLPAN